VAIKVVIATRVLEGVLGGLERQLKEISEALCDMEFQVHLMYLSHSGEDPFFNFDERIIHHKILSQNPQIKGNILKRISRQIEIFKVLKKIKPNVIVSFMTGAFFFTCLPSKALRIPIVLAERNSPQMYEVTSVNKNKYLIFLFMLFATKITTQFREYVEKYPVFLRRKFVVIPNAIPREILKLSPAIKLESKPFTYIFAGRFSFQKRVELLVRAFASFASTHQDVVLKIFGSGPNFSLIQEQITALNIEGQILLSPPTTVLSREILESDVLCIPSLWEGFPNVLLESLYLGVPALGFSNCDGVKHLIVDGTNGWLADYVADGSSLVSLLERSYLYLKSEKSMCKKCRESVKDFIPEKVYSKWRQLILEIAK
jgi:glycosyltransferase involved in cell wall biosynthesis